LGFRVDDLWLRLYDFWCGVQGVRHRVQGSGLTVEGQCFGFWVSGFGCGVQEIPCPQTTCAPQQPVRRTLLQRLVFALEATQGQVDEVDSQSATSQW
jgi:hypothetical protein